MLTSNMLIIGYFVLFSAFRVTYAQRDVHQMSIFPSLPVTVTKSDNTVCKEHSDLYVDSLRNYTLWAHEMWDATAKSSTGVLRGSVYQMGHFEQCLTAKAPFLTQYCLATVTAHIPKPDVSRDHLSLYFEPYGSIFQRLYKYNDVSQQSRNVIKMGWCLPASCSILNLEEYLNNYLNQTESVIKKKNVTYTAQFSNEFCQNTVESQYFDKADISFCFLAIILILLVIIATAYDYLKAQKELDKKPHKKSLSSKLILSFSARLNFHDLNRADDSNSALTILYGIRTICILAIIMEHRTGTFISSALLNFNFVESQYRSSIACLLFHGDLFVDTFFVLSGLLVVYSLLNQFDKRPMNPGYIVFLRYIRLTPVYAFVIFYYATIFNHTGSGPLWKVVAGGDSKDCRNNWWTNLLYISNYVNADHMCMTHSWYLPCDFHYFIIAIFLCLLIRKEKKSGLIVLAGLTIASMIVPFVLTVVYQRPALLYFYPEFLTGPKIHPDFLLTYSKSHTRATPYCVGMFAGYIYYKLKGSDKYISRSKSLGIVAISLCLLCVAVFTGKVFYDPYHNYNAIESGSYAAFHRLAWAVGSAGLLYVTSFGHASFIKKILCWSPWIPLSKLVYGAYLVHMQFQLRSAASFMNPRHISYFDVFSLSLSDMVLSFVIALCLFLMIEAPVRKIFRLILSPTKETPPKSMAEHLTVGENMINNNTIQQDSRL